MQEWAKARDYILPALQLHVTHTEDDVIVRLISGEYKLWRNDGAALITAFAQYPQFKAVEIKWGGGDLSAILEIKPQVEKFARNNGCREVVAGGREGWGKVCNDYTRCGAFFFKEV